MSIQQTTTSQTEADFESEIQAALKRAFPWIGLGAIRHQTKFSFNFGQKKIAIDGASDSRAWARSDILLFWKEQPLAVLELKRADHPIKKEDTEQGLSYARMLHPSPPLVVITNGKDLSILETHTAKEWTPLEPSEEEFKHLLQSASAAASDDLKQAISTLMGSTPAVWSQAIRRASTSVIQDLMGEWDDALQPFVPNFLIPRKAIALAMHLINSGQRLILIEGAPLAGKSSALRELAVRTEESSDLVTFYVQADVGTGIYQKIADTLTETLSWPITREEARNWLLRLSRASGPAIIIAVDGMQIGRDDVRRDIDDLTSRTFGKNIRVVMALDDSLADRLVLNEQRRNKSAIGRRACRIPIGSLDDDEFHLACEILWNKRLAIMDGGQSAPEMRIPWILRSIAAQVVSQPRYADEQLAGVLPPLLGLDLIQHARARFRDPELIHLMRQTAKAVLRDSGDRKRPIGLIVLSMATFVVRHSTLRKFLESQEIRSLTDRGFLRLLQEDSGELVMVIRVPEFLASEIAGLIGSELAERSEESPGHAARWLEQKAIGIPLGDVIAAQAILDAAGVNGTLPLPLITSLLNSVPKSEVLSPGTKAVMYLPRTGVLDVSFQSDGSILMHAGDEEHRIEPESEGQKNGNLTANKNVHGWLILSHLAGVPLEVRRQGRPPERADLGLLLEVGTCPFVLRSYGNDPEVSSVFVHNVADVGEIVCHKSGIVEPITLSLFRYLASAGTDAGTWIKEAVTRKSLPLLARVQIALRTLEGTANPDNANFAHNTLRDIIEPALKDLPALH